MRVDVVTQREMGRSKCSLSTDNYVAAIEIGCCSLVDPLTKYKV